MMKKFASMMIASAMVFAGGTGLAYAQDGDGVDDGNAPAEMGDAPVGKAVKAYSGKFGLTDTGDGDCLRNGARRCSLNGNRLIEDHDDVFTFPQKAHSKYNANLVRLDTDGDNAQGTFFSKTGSGGAWGLAVSHAPVVQDAKFTPPIDRDNPDDPADPRNQSVNAFQVLDLFYSGGGSKAWGIRLNIANGLDVDGSGQDKSNLNFGLSAGYSTTGNFAMDLGASIHYGGFSIKDVGAVASVDFDANFRGYIKKFAKKIDLGFLARLGYRTDTFVYDIPGTDEPTQAVGIFNLAAGAGPVYRLADSTVSLYGILKIRGATDAEPKDQYLEVAIPEVNLAFETPINDWMWFRGGIGYNFILSGCTPGDDDETCRSQAERGGEAISRRANQWTDEELDAGGATSSIGIAGKWDDLTLDVAVNKKWLTNGPYFATGKGTADDWGSKAAVSYRW
ncbi:MAG: hypothetical protein VX589_12115 [Myxococcota bacterium]|nr:hypothetical protein [Myxococcota bacterium]